jgi:hypothetical protein
MNFGCLVAISAHAQQPQHFTYTWFRAYGLPYQLVIWPDSNTFQLFDPRTGQIFNSTNPSAMPEQQIHYSGPTGNGQYIAMVISALFSETGQGSDFHARGDMAISYCMAPNSACGFIGPTNLGHGFQAQHNFP